MARPRPNPKTKQNHRNNTASDTNSTQYTGILEAVYRKLKELAKDKNAEFNRLFGYPPDSGGLPRTNFIRVKWAFNSLHIDDTEIQHKETKFITIKHKTVVITTYDWQDPQLLDKLEDIINTIS